MRFSALDKNDLAASTPHTIGDRDMMDFMIDLCVASKERSLRLFPIDNPAQWDKNTLPGLTREIFAGAIGNLISIYLWMWGK